MGTTQPDYYYRDFSSNILPARTPFTRAGQDDSGQLFIYVSNRRRRWSLLLAKDRVEQIYPEARKHIPPGFAHVWLLEKRYSTRLAPSHVRTHTRAKLQRPPANPQGQGDRTPVTGLGESFVVLAEPSQSPGAQGDVLSYHLRESQAVEAAEEYTKWHRRRAVVGLLVWDDYWF